MLKTIEILNFQPHKNTIIEFHSGVIIHELL